MSACPVTGLRTPLRFAALRLTAQSMSRGPSRVTLPNCLRSAIFERIAASSVDGIAGFTCSMADSAAISGRGKPRTPASRMTFSVIATFSTIPGKLLMYVSVSIVTRPAPAG